MTTEHGTSQPRQYEELRRLASEATPGPWRWFVDDYESGTAFVGTPNQDDPHYYIGGNLERDNAAYIAAASPDVVLRLIQERDALARLAQQWMERDQLSAAEYASLYGEDALGDDELLVAQTRAALAAQQRETADRAAPADRIAFRLVSEYDRLRGSR